VLRKEGCDSCDLILSSSVEVLFMPTFDAKLFHELLQLRNTRRCERSSRNEIVQVFDEKQTDDTEMREQVLLWF
jgi:hypothetical protein